MSEFPDLRQIVVVHEEMWEAISSWAGRHGLRLAQMPSDEDGTENYCLTFV